MIIKIEGEKRLKKVTDYPQYKEYESDLQRVKGSKPAVINRLKKDSHGF